MKAEELYRLLEKAKGRESLDVVMLVPPAQRLVNVNVVGVIFDPVERRTVFYLSED